MLKQTATYQDIELALEKGGCPICRVGHKLGRSHLELFLWGSVNDPGFRSQLQASLGFCDRHSQATLGFSGERLGVAIVEQALLKEALRRLRGVGGPPRRSLRQRLSGRLGRQGTAGGSTHEAPPLQPAGPCPVCQHEAEVEARGIEVLLENLVGDLDRRLQDAGGLCYPHLEQALRVCYDAEAYAALLHIHEQVWQELAGHLGEFIRKRDYRYSHEPLSDAESASIERAIAALTGEKDALVTNTARHVQRGRA